VTLGTLSTRGSSQPRIGWPTWVRALWHNAFVYSKTWRSSIVTGFLEPFMYLVAMGVGIGSLVNKGSGGVDGVPYLNFVAPGLLAATMLQIGVSDSSFSVLGGLKWARTYFAAIATPLNYHDVLIGHLAWIAIRCSAVATAFVAVMGVFGLLASPLAILAIPAAALSALAISSPTTAIATRQDDHLSMTVVFRLGVLPMFLFAGVFFPLSRLPYWLEVIVQILPLTSGVTLCRALTLHQGLHPSLFLNIGYMLLWFGVGYYFSLTGFRKRLVI